MEKKIYSIHFKEIIKLSLVLATLFMSSMVFGQGPANGLKLYYDFTSVSGTSVPDVTANGLNGTLMGAATVATGKLGNGVSCPAVTDYILLPNGITNGLTDFTVATWVNVTALNQWGRIFDFGSNTNYYMFLTTKSGSGKPRFAFKNNGGEQAIDGNSVFPTGTWVHVAVTCKYTAGVGVGTLYINGAVAGTNNNITITPAMLDPTTQNYIGKSQWPDPALAGTVDEFRIYNRAVSSDEILVMAGFSTELKNQYNALTLSGLSSVKTKLTLPVTMGSGGVTVYWKSSNKGVIDTLGNVTQPVTYDRTVVLSATLKLNTDSLVKTFIATVPATNPPVSPLLAKWSFKDKDISTKDGVVTVKDESGSGLVGTLKDVASIRTIGKDTAYNVLDLGNNKGYFDMDTVIGKHFYGLNNYTIGAYFRVDSDYVDINKDGNFLWTLSNTYNIDSAKNGYIIGILHNEQHRIATTWYQGDQGTNGGADPSKGTWHHFAYSQNGTSGNLYIDGVLAASTTVTLFPSDALSIAGRVGTRYNWIGRSPYTNDKWLRKTLVYDFELYSIPMSVSDLNDPTNMGSIADTIGALNRAYQKNKGFPPSLTAEWEKLSLGDLSNVTVDVPLPLKGAVDTTVKIRWASTRPGALDTTGVVIRPDYVNATVTLTATLTRGTYTLTKVFPATVVAAAGTEYTSDLLLNYNFAGNLVSGTTVSDAAEKHFSGTLMNGATVDTIGKSTKFNVLNLRNDTAYFDMGTECGKVIYGLNDYTISVFFLIDSTKTNLNDNGNFIYTFANSSNAVDDRNGYIFGRATHLDHCVSSKAWDWNDGNFATGGRPTKTDSSKFHHMVYTQKGTYGTVYFDGDTTNTGSRTFTNLPSVALPKPGFTGTLFNWLGKSCYVSDKYLGQALIADFKLYKKALTFDEVQAMQTETQKLNDAYKGIINAVPTIAANTFYINTSIPGQIKIENLKENAKVAVYNLLGQKVVEVKNINAPISLKSGIYIVQVDNNVTKVYVE
jgi:hypothetical protein